MRVENLDRDRELAGCRELQLKTLRAFGFEWDGPILRQSERSHLYAAAIESLRERGLTYGCACTRKEIAQTAVQGPEGPIYPGTCRQGTRNGRAARSQRFRIPNRSITFVDRIQGQQTQDLCADVGDFVIRRADGIHAYQLAVVVDDADQGITEVVRGADLLLSTPRQIALQQALGLPRPSYAHVPLAVDDQGRKLSKSLAACPVDASDPLPALLAAWRFLDQPPPSPTPRNLHELWTFAYRTWRLSAVPRRTAGPSPSLHSPNPRSGTC